LINPETGGYKNIHQWKTTELIDSAKAYNCKVFLTISNFGGKNNDTFLSNSKSQETLADSIISLLSLRNANGINIDFEGLQPESKVKFTKFIAVTVILLVRIPATGNYGLIMFSHYRLSMNGSKKKRLAEQEFGL
jgi:spore germination protein YaaH